MTGFLHRNHGISFGNWQRQPKIGCQMVAKVAWQLATATSTPKGVCLWLPVAVAVLSNFRAWLVSVWVRPLGAGVRLADAWMKDILRNSGIYPLVANPVRARGRGRANADGSRACMCEPDARRKGGKSEAQRQSESDSGGRGRGFCDNLVTIGARWRFGAVSQGSGVWCCTSSAATVWGISRPARTRAGWSAYGVAHLPMIKRDKAKLQ